MEETKKNYVLLGGLLTTIMFSQTTYMNVAALLPTFICENHPSINSVMVGLLMASF
jgi:hypothetical protein